jgi:hypothetical protein
MAAATVIFILYAVSGGNLPDFTALSAFQSKAACESASADVTKALGAGQYGKTLVCLSSDSLNAIASANGVGK